MHAESTGLTIRVQLFGSQIKRVKMTQFFSDNRHVDGTFSLHRQIINSIAAGGHIIYWLREHVYMVRSIGHGQTVRPSKQLGQTVRLVLRTRLSKLELGLQSTIPICPTC